MFGVRVRVRVKIGVRIRISEPLEASPMPREMRFSLVKGMTKFIPNV